MRFQPHHLIGFQEFIYIKVKSHRAQVSIPKFHPFLSPPPRFSHNPIPQKTSSGTQGRKITHCSSNLPGIKGFAPPSFSIPFPILVFRSLTMVLIIYAVSLRRLTKMVITTYLFLNSKNFSTILSSGN